MNRLDNLKQENIEEEIVSLVLVVDKGGMPKDWVNFELAACYYAKEKVLWEIGNTIKTMFGGHNNHGEQSRIDIKSIIGVSGPLLGDITHSFVAGNASNASVTSFSSLVISLVI